MVPEDGRFSRAPENREASFEIGHAAHRQQASSDGHRIPIHAEE